MLEGAVSQETGREDGVFIAETPRENDQGKTRSQFKDIYIYLFIFCRGLPLLRLWGDWHRVAQKRESYL